MVTELSNISSNIIELLYARVLVIRLRKVQLWMISSALEQAIGRARLLRNDCTVTVFARFPVDQAKVM